MNPYFERQRKLNKKFCCFYKPVIIIAYVAFALNAYHYVLDSFAFDKAHLMYLLMTIIITTAFIIVICCFVRPYQPVSPEQIKEELKAMKREQCGEEGIDYIRFVIESGGVLRTYHFVKAVEMIFKSIEIAERNDLIKKRHEEEESIVDMLRAADDPKPEQTDTQVSH
ncbi:hypothetical protein ACI0X9_003293 [Cronobacter turicensis]